MMAKSSTVIEVHLRTAEQLYNSFDPSPFHERDLDDEAERYIAGWAREIRGTDAVLSQQAKDRAPSSYSCPGSDLIGQFG